MPTLVEVAEAQKTDKFCRTVLSDPRTIHGRDHLFFVDDDILCHRHRHLDSTITQIVIPAKYQLAIVKAVHHSSVGGHLGQAKTVSMLMNLGYYFPSMRSIVNRVVSTCHQCQRANAHKNTNLASFAANMAPFPSVKWNVISSDPMIGPFTATSEGSGYRYILVPFYTHLLHTQHATRNLHRKTKTTSSVI